MKNSTFDVKKFIADNTNYEDGASAMQRYTSLDDIPPELRTEDSLAEWLVIGVGNINTVSAEYVTDKIRLAAAAGRRNCFYRRTLQADIESINNFDPDVATEDWVAGEVLFNKDLVHKLDFASKHNYLLTSSFFEKLIRLSVVNAAYATVTLEACGLKRPKVSDESLAAGIINNLEDAGFVKLFNHDLIEKMVIDGFWPSKCLYIENMSDKKGIEYFTRPENIEDAADRIRGLGCRSTTAIHIAFIKSHPIAEVVETLGKTQKGMITLGRVYKDEELRPHMKHSRLLKAKFLENDLGL